MDSLVLLEVTGDQLHKTLENGVSQWPKLEGRFPQVSGIKFLFDPSQPPGSRINPENIEVSCDRLVPSGMYKLVTKGYLATGKDGYDVLANAKILIDEECSPDLTTVVQNHFQLNSNSFNPSMKLEGRIVKI